MYKLANQGVIRLSDGAAILPHQDGWEAYMQYIVAGNAPLPPDPILPRPLNDLRLDKLAAVRAEAYHRISAKWPLWKQLNAALGVETLAKIAELRGDITAVKTASNTAEAAIIAATTNAELEAVNALWPTI